MMTYVTLFATKPAPPPHFARPRSHDWLALTEEEQECAMLCVEGEMTVGAVPPRVEAFLRRHYGIAK